jgi:DNA-binding phage protein
MTSKVRRHRDFDEYLQERFQYPTLALLYLNEAATDKDVRVFLLALKHVLIAQGRDMSSIAE